MEYDNAISTLKENLDYLSSREQTVKSQLHSTLRSTAEIVYNSFSEFSIEHILDKFQNAIKTNFTSDSIFLCEALLSKKERRTEIEKILGHDAETTAAGTHGKIAYTKNKLNDMAFESFSCYIRSAKAVTVSTFNDACEAVNNGESEFCILPIEKSDDGKLFGFYALLDRYELKIKRVCDVDADDGSHTVRYALVGKKSFMFDEHLRSLSDFILEFSIITANGSFFAEMMIASELCCATPISIDSKPLPYNSQLKKYFFSFALSQNNAVLMQLWLSLCYESFSLIGLYPEI